VTSYTSEASDTLRTAQGKGVPACRPGSLEPFCCSPGCPDCSPVSPIGRTHQEAAEARKRKREATADAEVVELPSGMRRSNTADKTDYTLALDGPMFERWAKHLTAAVPSKGKRNWMYADDEEDLQRFREGFMRHAVQWLRGDNDEDHAAALFFNVNGAEYVKDQLGR
jgi:hypothetical protein